VQRPRTEDRSSIGLAVRLGQADDGGLWLCWA